MLAEKITAKEYLGIYPLEDVYVRSIHSKMSEDEERLRIYIMNSIIDNKEPFDLKFLTKELCRDINIDFSSALDTVFSIRDKEGMVVEDNKAVFIYPVSSKKTSHRVTLEDGRSFYAMCAIDSLGSHFTFNQRVKINSKCSKCNEIVEVEVENGQIKSYFPGNLHILHGNMKKFKNWGNSC